ncbi:MAG: leucine-rich repeat protein [Firmicutes bacterium]|nr:leucine-rich repeat protein [Bacillota bacterium]
MELSTETKFNLSELSKLESKHATSTEIQRQSSEPVNRYPKQGNWYVKNTENTENAATIKITGTLNAESALQKAAFNGGMFNFSTSFNYLKPIFNETDLVIGNLNTAICPSQAYSSENLPNSPVEYLSALQYAGFDFLTMANANNADFSLNGIKETLFYVNKFGFGNTGLFSPNLSQKNQNPQRCLLINVNNIKIAVLSYSQKFTDSAEQLNAKGKQTFLNEYSTSQLKQDISYAKSAGAEFILVCLFATGGNIPVLAQRIADSGADYICFHTPNKIREYDIIQSESGKAVPVFYSLGSLYSGNENPAARQSIIAAITLQKENGVVKISAEEYIPCYTYNNYFGNLFPIIPTLSVLNGNIQNKTLINAHDKIIKTVKYKINTLYNTRLTTRFVCDALGLEIPKESVAYNKLAFAKNAKKNDIVFMLVTKEIVVMQANTYGNLMQMDEETIEELAHQAMQNGAKLLVHTSQIKDYPCLIVPNVEETFINLTKKYREQFSPFTIAVIGSVGKTTTTQIIRQTLLDHVSTHGHAGNHNDLENFALVTRRLNHAHKYYVQEISEVNLSTEMVSPIMPNVLIVTLIGTAHLEESATKLDVLAACLAPEKIMPDDGLLIMNADDELQTAAKTRLQKIYYGINNPQADYRAVNIKTELDSTTFDVLHKEKIIANLQTNFFGLHNVYNTLAAFVALNLTELTIEDIQNGFVKYFPQGIRQNFCKIGNYNLYLDCFNNSFENIESLLDLIPFLPPISENGNYILFLADILDWTYYTDEIYQSIGEMIAKSNVNTFVGYGEKIKIALDIAQAKNPNLQTLQVTTFDQLVETMSTIIKTDDLVLIKGNHRKLLDLAVDIAFGTWFKNLLKKEAQGEIVHSANYTAIAAYKYAKIIDYTSEEMRVIIPPKINGQPVYSIGETAFMKSEITSVTFPETVLNIRKQAFSLCKNLTKVNLPPNLRLLDSSAFVHCENLQQVTMGNKVLEIHSRAFAECTNLQKINIPPSCTVIEEDAFLNCEQLTIYGEIGSFAEEYARQNDIVFAEN